MPLSVTVSAAGSVVDGTDTVALQAVVANDKNNAGVSWSVNGGGSVSGSTGAATYTAPAAGGSALTVSVKATSVADPTKSGTVTLTVPAAPAITNEPGNGLVGTAYTARLSAGGGIAPYTWSVAGGALPAGLTLSPDGSVSGTPLAAGSGTTEVTVQVTDSGKPNALSTTAKVPFTVAAAPAIGFGPGTTLADATAGSSYSATVAALGGAGSLAHSLLTGSLPDGLTLAANGTISGIPTAAGTFAFTVKACDGYGDSGSQAFSLRVNWSSALAVTVPALPTAYIGLNYAPFALKASGGSGTGYSWSVAKAASLPAGMTFSAAGLLSGTPTVVGSSTFGVQVTDSAGDTATGQVTLVVKPGITMTSATTLPGGDAQVLYSTMLAATGGASSPYLWSVAAGSSLPSGLTLGNNGLISGTPTTPGTFQFALTVKDLAGNTASGSFWLTIGSGVIITSATDLGATWVGAGFVQALHAAGGTGSGYTWTLNTGSVLPAGIAIRTNPAELLGNPTAAGQYSFGLTVTDSGGNTASATFHLTVNGAIQITSPATLPDGSVGVSYTDALTAFGGTGGGYIWTVTAGADALKALGLTASTTGVVSGTPTVAGTAAFTISVTDASLMHATANLRVTVAGPGGPVSGTISLTNNCTGAATPPITVSINTNPVQTTSTDPSGAYRFAAIPQGTYTITPTLAGSAAQFYPASLNGVVVGDSGIAGQNFAVAVGYNVSGTVSYAGAGGGPIYLTLSNGCNSTGTSISGPGPFTIRGVAPGTYTLQSWRDSQKFGYPDMADASGFVSGVVVGSSDVNSVSVVLQDPVYYTLSTGPGLNSISPMDSGVIVNFGAIIGTNGNGTAVETATAYTIEWSTDPEFETNVMSHQFIAGGADGTGVWLLNSAMPGLSGKLVNGTGYYFRARGEVSAGPGPWTVFGGSGNPTQVVVGAPSGGNTVTGTISTTSIPSGPLYVGFFDRDTGRAYATSFANPGAAQPYSVRVPSGSYIFFAVLDQNQDGMIDPGDISNTHNQVQVTIGGDATQDLTLTDVTSTAYVMTQRWDQTTPGSGGPATSTGYGLSFDLAGDDKLPVSVTLTSGPNVINPVDLAKCVDCGHPQFQYQSTIGATMPKAGDAYAFEVTYSDGTAEQVTGTVSGVVSQPPTDLAPAGATGSGANPTFSWTDPANAGNYSYAFSLWDSQGNVIWQIPASNSQVSGFDSSITAIQWGKDPMGLGSSPSVPGLTPGATYYWQIQMTDQNGNSAAMQTSFVP